MSIRILHTSDIHYCREHRADALESLEVLLKALSLTGSDLVVIAGDLFDRGIQASDRDGMPELLKVIGEILDLAPIVAVQGTPTHDVAGCYEVLRQLRGKHAFTVLFPDTAYFLQDDGEVTTEPGDLTKLLILGCPEPGKDWLLANKTGLGSAEATQAVNDSMRALLLGLGGMRREHPDLPCLMVYHGSVRGATMGSGQVVGSTELAIGTEDLALVAADYYALGHIHQAQKVSEIPAYYAGSAYPTDWGELDQKSFRYVDTSFGGWQSSTMEYPHPPRMKKVTSALDNDGVDVAGKQVWWVVRDTAENCRGLDEESILQTLTRAGALPGSRVTIETIPTETVRAEAITKVEHLRAKVCVYAIASGEGLPADSILDKADTLEVQAREEGAVGAGAHIRLLSLRLRGAIGIWKGLGEDEITLDLDAYGAGLLALVGPNGAGKTTLIENLHPFPQMLTRGGALQSHFRLKDSARELVWVDEQSGVTYKALILIDPTLSTPKAEYHLYQRTGGEWEPMTNGRKEDYVEKITELWGSIDLFVRSAFVAQKPPKGHPDLAEATPAERKSLFRELGGLDYLQVYAEAAKARADNIAQMVGEDQAKAGVLRPLLEQEPECRMEYLAAEEGRKVAAVEVEQIRGEGVEQRKAVEDLAERWKGQQRVQSGIDHLRREREKLDAETYVIAQRIDAAETAQEGRAAAEAMIQKAEDLKKAEGVLREEETDVLRERERLSGDHAGALAAHRAALDELAATERRLEKQAADLRSRKAALVATVDLVGASVERPIDDTCQTCGQKLPAEKRAELEAAREKSKVELAGFQGEILGYDAAILDIEDSLKATAKRRDGLREPVAPVLPTFGQKPALDAILTELRKLYVAKARETVRAANEAQAALDAAEIRKVEIRTRIDAVAEEEKVLAAQVDERIDGRYEEAKRRLEELRELHTGASKSLARLEAEAKALRATCDDLARKREQLAGIEASIGSHQAELADWRYLERACGRDGIQALELDAMGPSIAQEANGLLDAAYGTRFRLDIRTTRIAGKGAKTKQVEDFEIIVRDTERGTEQPLDTLSGGETVWVRKALYDAFGIIRARSTGTMFLTAMLDEADGALDPEARMRYVAMLKAAHQAAGRRHTIVITHSEAAQEAIEQRIEMLDLVREKEAVA